MPPPPKLDKGQRSIAAMFGVKEPATRTTTNTTTPTNTKKTTNSSGKKTSNGKSTTTTSSGSNKNRIMSNLARIPYEQIEEIDREFYYKTLSNEFQEILELELDFKFGLGLTYLNVLKLELTKEYFLNLKKFLIKQKQIEGDSIFPNFKNIYSWSRFTPLDKIRVVIIGQDPYHGPGQAHGLSFSVPKGIPIPGSLRNIYQELKQEYPNFKIPNHGNLTTWAESGVLLLNTSLTVKRGEAGSHSNRGWEQFTDAVVDAIDLYGGIGLLNHHDHHQDNNTVTSPPPPVNNNNKRIKLDNNSLPSSDISPSKDHDSLDTKNDHVDQSSLPIDTPKNPSTTTTLNKPTGFGQGVVFLCWGKWAADRVTRLSETKHLILKSAHPSPLSAHRGFLGNNHFKLANQWLEKKYGKSAQIDWSRL